MKKSTEKKYPGVRLVGKYWHIYYNVNGRQYKESSHSTKQMDAVRLRAKRITDSQPRPRANNRENEHRPR